MSETERLTMTAACQARKAAYLEWAQLEAAALAEELAILPIESPARKSLEHQVWVLKCDLALHFMYPYTNRIGTGA